MTGPLLEQIPADRREAAREAVAAAFGRAAVTEVAPITTGASGALIYRLEIAERPYLLRLEPPQSDQARAYHCMQTAADAGVAPRLYHADPHAGVAIMDFLPRRPLAEYPTGPAGLARDLGALAARLQATAIFPAGPFYPVFLGDMLERLRDSGRFPAGLLDPHREALQHIRAVYPWTYSALVSSNNDLHPGNIIFDGERLWVIDWDLGFRNDCFLDVAILGMHLAATPGLLTTLLQSWRGRPPEPADRARVVLMQQLARLFYGCASCLRAGDLGAPPETDLEAPSPAAFWQEVAAGRLQPGTREMHRVGGKVALVAFRDGLAAPAFAKALALLARG